MTKPETNSFSRFLWWKYSQENLHKQVNKYSTLSLIKSYRKVAGLLMFVPIALFALMGALGLVEGIWWTPIVAYLPLVIFVYRGHRWAIVVSMIFITFDRVYELFLLVSEATSLTFLSRAIFILLIWSIFMFYLIGAYKVENLRHAARENKGLLKPKIFKGKVYVSIFILFVLALLGTLFYWYEIRPAQIKHGCSWVRHYEEAKPAKEGVSEEELWQSGRLKDCSRESESIFNRLNRDFCEDRNKKIIEESKSEPAEPEREWFTKATEKEYQFCLRDKGLE